MNQSEKIVWSVVYAIKWDEEQNRSFRTGKPACIESAIENAFYAVKDMKSSLEKVKQGWGEEDEVTIALKEILGVEQ